MNRSFVGHSDLARIFSACSDAPRGLIAGLLGWADRAPEPAPLPSPPPASEGETAEPSVAAPAEPSGLWPGAAEPCPFWRVARIVPRAVMPTSELVAAEPGRLEWRNPPPTPPMRRPLCPWPALVPRLRSGLQAPTRSRRIDWRRVVERIAKGKFIRCLPVRSVKRWGERVLVVLDRSDRLVPYWDDQLAVLDRLRQLVPAHGLEVYFGMRPDSGLWRISRTGKSHPFEAPAPSMRALVLGDLGCLQSDGGELHTAWALWGQALRASGCHPVALVPCAAELVPEPLRKAFTVLSGQKLPHALVRDPDERRETVERLLRLVAPAVRLEPGLLRDVRALLPGADAAADASLESSLWQHPAVVSPHPVAATLDADHAKDVLLPQFEREPEELRRVVLDVVRSWRHGLDPLVWLQEVARLPQDSRGLVPATDREDARLALHHLATRAATPGGGGAALKDYVDRAVSRLPVTAWADSVVGPVYRLLQKRCFPNGELGLLGGDPAEHDRGPTTLTFDVRQHGSELTFAPAAPVPSDRAGGIGSPLGSLRTTNRMLRVDDYWQEGWAEDEIPRPIWAADFGQDQYGPWATIQVKSVTQRVRWIPAGRFVMGAPDSEVGRYSDEGPVHEVVISRGYWLFDTPCTQGLWSAVMGKNPSQFKDPRRPVENVSWEDVGRFLVRVNGMVAGLELALPTEAEWEYACRAGTTTSTYEVDGEIIGENNAPGLDALAWYGGNSGWEYDLGEGVDSSEWPEKQYPHTKAGTRRVSLKLANGWGLYDMLGNVREWCRDGQRLYTTAGVVDPTGPTEAGADRVVRGGGWASLARHVRAAYRSALAPADRIFTLGFRCLSSGRAEPTGAQPAANVRGRLAEPGPRTETSGGAVAVALGEAEAGRCPLPRAPNVLIRSDLDDLLLERITQPRWATAIGRDGFGLWAEFEVRGKKRLAATQRVRWIPAGRFWMGSPDSEVGRYADEGPVHEVVLSRGYWLFDTPCTQGLWSAVMGKNPSQFKDPRRPVESVSWEDVTTFLNRLNGMIAGLELELPTEAQWEYACRAGTISSTYDGDVAIAGENNAPGLDAVAWYGGNSGWEYDLEEGADSSEWPEKQYPHTKAGTRRVSLKLANGWGLYDMLGNVWEWCRDGQRLYTTAGVVDPTGPAEAGAVRVVRGGGWNLYARNVRAAYRYAYAPVYRNGHLGFRCLSSGR